MKNSLFLRNVLFLAALIGSLGFFTSQAQAEDLSAFYAVRHVAVDQTGENSDEARTKAILQGQRLAFQTLYERLTQPHQQAPSVEDEALTKMVKGFEVEEEHREATRYTASLSYYFLPEAVRKLVSNDASSAAVSKSKGRVLVLPLLQNGPSWQPQTSWVGTWQKKFMAHSFAYTLPQDLGSQDEALLQNIMKGNAASVSQIAQRYGASKVLVAVLDQKHGLQANISGYQDTAQKTSFTVSAPKMEALIQGILSQYQAEEGIVEAQQQGPALSIPATAAESALTLSVPVTSLEDMNALKNKLAQIPGVAHVQLTSLSTSEVVFKISFTGEAQKINEALLAEGFKVTKDTTAPEKIWHVTI